MGFGLLNLLMLFGLAGLAIPPLIHLLNRRRYNVVDWGAMQFLQISDAKRRRLLIEELLLMLLRMGLIAIMVLALANPYGINSVFSALGLRQNRDVVLVFGGSASMDARGAHEAAKEWALDFIDDLEPGDNVVILQAKEQVVPVLGEPTSDFRLAKRAVEELPPPGGGCDWPRAVQEAHRILEQSKRPLRSIILLGDGQRHGWADDDSRGYWQALSDQLPTKSKLKPRVWFLNFDSSRPASPPNWALAPLRTKRVTAYVNQDVEFETDLLLYGQSDYQPPEWVVKEIDGERPADSKLRFPSKAEFDKKRPTRLPLPARDASKANKAPTKQDVLVVPLPSFRQKFTTPGSHLVSVATKPKSGKEVRQSYAVNVLPLPVLIVDGDPEPAATVRWRTFYLRRPLDPRDLDSKKLETAVITQLISIDKFKVRMLTEDVDKAWPGSKPRVLVLADVPRLSADLRKGIEKFLEGGGGVLVTLGNRVDGQVTVGGHVEKNKDHYNKELFRDGKGWLPARLATSVKKKLPDAAGPLLSSFNHPALERSRRQGLESLGEAYFRGWWQVVPAEGENKAVVAARLTSRGEQGNDPLLVQGTYKGGRVFLCTVPLTRYDDTKDLSWDSNLVTSLEFVPLIQELVRYLAGDLSTRADKKNLQIHYNLLPGQPLYYGLGNDEAADRLTLAVPGSAARPVVFKGSRRLDTHLARRTSGSGGDLLDFGGTQHTGVYTLTVPPKEDWLPADTATFFGDVFSSTRKVYYTVHSDDPGEFDLTPWTADDRAEVARLVPVDYETDGAALSSELSQQANTQELWEWFLVAVLVLICCEVWFTRKIVRAR